MQRGWYFFLIKISLLILSTFALEGMLDGLLLRVPKNTDARLATASSLKNKMRIADKLEGTLTTMERTC